MLLCEYLEIANERVKKWKIVRKSTFKDNKNVWRHCYIWRKRRSSFWKNSRNKWFCFRRKINEKASLTLFKKSLFAEFTWKKGGKICILMFQAFFIYAEVVTHVAGSLEAEGLPRYPWRPTFWNKHDEARQSCLSLYYNNFTGKTQGLKLYTKCLHYQSEIK